MGHIFGGETGHERSAHHYHVRESVEEDSSPKHVTYGCIFRLAGDADRTERDRGGERLYRHLQNIPRIPLDRDLPMKLRNE